MHRHLPLIIVLLLLPALSLFPNDAKTIEFKFFLHDTDNEKYVISFPYCMAFDDEESIYILDFKECCIMKFSEDGKYINTIGRKGRGPGEITCPGYITVKDEKLYYIDFINLINVYSLDGKLLGSESKKKTSADQKAFPEKLIVGLAYEKSANSDLLKEWDWDGKEISVINTISWDKYLKPSNNKYRISSIAASNIDINVFDIDSKGSVIFAESDKYEVFKWSDGKSKRIINENHTYKLLPNEKRKKNRLEKGKGIITFFISNEYYPVISEVIADKEDNIWLVTISRDRAGLAKYRNDGSFIAFYEVKPWYLIEGTRFYISKKYIYCSIGSSEGYRFFRAEIPQE